MNAEDIIWRLAQLASLPYQERYVIGGTKDEYVLAVDLLENVDSLKYLICRSDDQSLLNADQSAALKNLFAYIEQNSGEALAGRSPEEGAKRIRESDVWKTLRAKAAAALKLFGVCIGRMSAEEVDKLADEEDNDR